MEAVKAWARSLLILSVLSSTVLLLVPRSMQKQTRFVAEMLLLVCILAPLARLVGSESLAPPVSSGGVSPRVPGVSLGQFLAEETARRVAEIGRRVGVPVENVRVTAGESGFALHEVTVDLSGRPDGETLRAFRETLAAYLGVGQEILKVVVPGSPQGTGP